MGISKNFNLQMSDFRWQISDFRCQITDGGEQMSDVRFQIIKWMGGFRVPAFAGMTEGGQFRFLLITTAELTVRWVSPTSTVMES
jgi:hypothetical protein